MTSENHDNGGRSDEVRVGYTRVNGRIMDSMGVREGGYCIDKKPMGDYLEIQKALNEEFMRRFPQIKSIEVKVEFENEKTLPADRQDKRSGK